MKTGYIFIRGATARNGNDIAEGEGTGVVNKSGWGSLKGQREHASEG